MKSTRDAIPFGRSRDVKRKRRHDRSELLRPTNRVTGTEAWTVPVEWKLPAPYSMSSTSGTSLISITLLGYRSTNSPGVRSRPVNAA